MVILEVKYLMSGDSSFTEHGGTRDCRYAQVVFDVVSNGECYSILGSVMELRSILLDAFTCKVVRSAMYVAPRHYKIT